MSRLFGRAMLIALLATPVVAQPHPMWFFTSGGSNTNPVVLGSITSGGAVSTILQVASLPANVYGQNATLEHDDDTFAMTIISKVMNASVLRVDSVGQILQTIQVDSTNPQQGGGFTYGIAQNQDGEHIVILGNGGGSTADVLAIDVTSTIRTLHSGAPLVAPTAVAIDIDTGGYAIYDTRNRAVYMLAPDGATITSITSLATGVTSSGHQLSQDLRSGDFLLGAGVNQTAAIMRINVGGVTTVSVSGWSVYGLHPDRASRTAPTAIYSSARPYGFYTADLNTGAVTTINGGLPTTAYPSVFPPRELASVKTGTGQWTVRLRCRGEAGNGYAIALSLSGVRPGVPLPDGRHLCFNIDKLSTLSLNGTLGSVFANNIGTINALDRAVATLDVTSLPGVAGSGARVFLQAITQSPSAPLTIQTIPDPIAITL